MTALTPSAATFTVHFGCDRACEVELDLDDVHGQTRLTQLLARAEAAHKEAHDTANPQRVFRWGKAALVRAVIGESAVAS